MNAPTPRGGVELGERAQQFDLEAERGEDRGSVRGQRLERPAGKAFRRHAVELGESAGRSGLAQLPQSPNRVEPHRRSGSRSIRTSASYALGARIAPSAMVMRMRSVSSRTLSSSSSSASSADGSRSRASASTIAARSAIAVRSAQARKQRSHGLVHAGVSEGRDRAKVI